MCSPRSAEQRGGATSSRSRAAPVLVGPGKAGPKDEGRYISPSEKTAGTKPPSQQRTGQRQLPARYGTQHSRVHDSAHLNYHAAPLRGRGCVVPTGRVATSGEICERVVWVTRVFLIKKLKTDKQVFDIQIGELRTDAALTRTRTRTRTNTNPNGTEANAAGRSVRACVARESKT